MSTSPTTPMSTKETESAAESVISSDPLDKANFDAIAYINERFPTEESLSELDTFLVAVRSQIAALDEEISATVQAQSSAGQLATREIAGSEAAIQELFSLVGEIKHKASASEKTVQEICFDIKRLDCAKTHLQGTITTLKRLQMLLTATQQLEVWRELPLREVANMLEAVSAIMIHFDKYTDTIPKIADIKTRIDTIREELKRHVQASFQEIGQLVNSVADPSLLVEDFSGGMMRSLSDACLVSDALGKETRQTLLKEFIQQQLQPYETLFGDGMEHHTLEQVDRRWAWFKRLVKTIDTKFATIIPPSWRIQTVLSWEFCNVTREHMLSLLRNTEDSADVSALLKALQTSLRFEQEARLRFDEEEKMIAEAETPVHASSNELDQFDPDADANEKTPKEESMRISNPISGVFDKYLGPYVKLEKNNLEELLERLDSEEDTTTDTTGGANAASSGIGSNVGSVYGSSASMFVFIKNSIKRCTALSNGATFLALTGEFKACMLKYAENLRMRLPIPQGAVNPVYKFTKENTELGVCYVINTCEYCAEVVPTLESIIQKTITPELADQIDLADETDAFLDISALAVKVLVSGTLDKLEPSFKSMQGLNWGSLAQVGEESPYVYKWQAVLQEMIPKIKEILTEIYFKNFCTKLATDILLRYLDVIMKQRKINEMGTQQLLLDTYNVKTLLLQLETIGIVVEGESKPQPSNTFAKLVNARIAHIEMVLKLIATPEEMLLERFQIMWPDGQSLDLQTIMNLKDMKRQEQQKYLEAFGGNTGSSTTSSSEGGVAASMSKMFQNTNLKELGSSAMNAFKGSTGGGSHSN